MEEHNGPLSDADRRRWREYLDTERARQVAWMREQAQRSAAQAVEARDAAASELSAIKSRGAELL
ncbi:MAG: hypothetical protein ACXV2J_10555, partial [Actinomycetes bacterium]